MGAVVSGEARGGGARCEFQVRPRGVGPMGIPLVPSGLREAHVGCRWAHVLSGPRDLGRAWGLRWCGVVGPWSPWARVC